ncbi:MAG: cobyrinate a,c-diamide synthase [Pseudomonadota bacterium]
MRGLLIAAPGSGHGKTIVTLGLLRALRNQDVRVVSGKSGPDYIDPAFHAAATGMPCITLDAWALDADALRGRARMLQHYSEASSHTDGSVSSSKSADLMIVEGAMGAFDGAISDGGLGKGSAAELASALGVPLVLVVDVSHIGQTVGAVVHGISSWASDMGATVSGVILNRVGSERHAIMARRAIETTCPVLGIIPRDQSLATPSRHLGLVQAEELENLDQLIARTAAIISDNCDLSAIQQLARPIDTGVRKPIRPLGQVVAVASDEAFSFAYWHMLQDWRYQGVEIAPFSPLADQGPSEAADAVFLPGGYPELHAGRIASATDFSRGMHAAAGRGALIYGECGGYMVLGDGLVDADGDRHPMLGMLRLETSFADRRLHLGYRSIDIKDGPWQGPAKAHEFHYATTLKAEGVPFAGGWDASGASLGPMGLSDARTMGSFAHIIDLA